MRSLKTPLMSALGFGITQMLAAQAPVTFLEGIGFGNASGDCMVVADFNNDGYPDVAEADAAFGLTIYLGNGKGAFTQLPTLAVYGNTYSNCIAAADFNGDGNLDLVVGGGPVMVLFGNGDGTFQAPVEIAAEGGVVATGDFNGDGFVDIASGVNGYVQLFLGDGNGNFVAGSITSVGAYYLTAMVTCGYCTKGGYTDLVVTTSTNIAEGDGYFAVLTPNSEQGFDVYQTEVASGNSFPDSLVVADFNGDGYADVAVADFATAVVSVFLGTRTGVFESPIHLAAPPDVDSLVAADLNGDGIPDLIAGSSEAEALVYLGKGNGDFTVEREIVTGFESKQIALADLTGDGSLYLISCNQTSTTTGANPPAAGITVMRSDGPGEFLAAEAYGLGPSPTGVTVADFNGDGIPDVAVVDSQSLVIFLGNGKGGLQPGAKYALTTSAVEIAAADVNHDGIIDLVTIGGSAVETFIGNGNGTFQTPLSSPCPGCDTGVILEDVNHDGNLDVITANHSGVAVLFGNGNGTFQTASIYPIYKPSSIAAGDLDGNGKVDAVVTKGYQKDGYGGVYILSGKSNGTFGPAMPLNDAGSSAIVADINGDGKLDIAMLFEGGVAVYLGNGNGTFQPPLLTTGQGVTAPLLAADFNGDGVLDIIGNSPYSGSAAILLGKGNGTFTFESRQYLVSSGIPAVPAFAGGNFDGPGDPDLLVISRSGNALWLLLNTTE